MKTTRRIKRKVKPSAPRWMPMGYFSNRIKYFMRTLTPEIERIDGFRFVRTKEC